ncbi:Deoxyribonuclease I [Pseudomonas coronafaciens pv. striafaciens]|nr:Deoxyribonuclease I [Pseudomonas coronafaciens pv. striafaciens]
MVLGMSLVTYCVPFCSVTTEGVEHPANTKAAAASSGNVSDLIFMRNSSCFMKCSQDEQCATSGTLSYIGVAKDPTLKYCMPVQQLQGLFPWQDKPQRPPPLPAPTSAWVYGYRRSSTRRLRKNPGPPCFFVSLTSRKTTGRRSLKK